MVYDEFTIFLCIIFSWIKNMAYIDVGVRWHRKRVVPICSVELNGIENRLYPFFDRTSKITWRWLPIMPILQMEHANCKCSPFTGTKHWDLVTGDFGRSLYSVLSCFCGSAVESFAITYCVAILFLEFKKGSWSLKPFKYKIGVGIRN